MRRVARIALQLLLVLLVASNNTLAVAAQSNGGSTAAAPNGQTSGGWQCIPQTDLYEEQNYVLHYKCCQNSSGTAAATNPNSNANAEVTPQACGETGKANSQENKNIMWSYLLAHFKNAGFSDQQAQYAAAAIMGNAEKESNFDPSAVNGIGCSGVVQWCFGRKDDKNDHRGSTINSLMGWANEHGGNWQCLTTQLDFLWHELTSTESAAMDPMKSATSAGDAANQFEHYYERSNTATGENLGRDSNANKIYQEYSGKGADASAATGSGSSTSNDNCSQNGSGGNNSNSGTSNGAIPSADCSSVVSAVKNDPKIKPVQPSWFNNDTSNCITGQATCNNGVHPEVFRLLEATAQNSGASEVDPRALNTGHPCDGLQHPNGEAMDFYCPRDNAAAMANCDKIFKYIYDNKDQLQVGQLIWNSKDMGDAGYSCGDPKVLCLEDHYDEIHVGIRK